MVWSVLILAILIAGCDSKPVATNTNEPPVATAKYTLPSEASLDATAIRGPIGEIFINGSTNLPNSLRFEVKIPDVQWTETVMGRDGSSHQFKHRPNDFKVIIQEGGRFESRGLLAANNKPIPPGKHKVYFFAIFNGNWQTKEMLKLVGDGGKNLHGKIFRKEDNDVIDSDLLLDYTMTLSFPPLVPLAPESQAIDLVKNAILTVPGRGRSATNIQENVDLYMGSSPKLSGLTPIGWSAKAEKGKTYLVTFDFIDAVAGPSQAVWSADLETKKVQYVNKLAKMFSWTPKE